MSQHRLAHRAVRLERASDQDRAQGARFLRRARRRFLPRALARTSRSGRDSPTDSGSGRRGSRRPTRTGRFASESFTGPRDAVSRRWSRRVCSPCCSDTSSPVYRRGQRRRDGSPTAPGDPARPSPALAVDAGLVESFAALRRGRPVSAGHKMLVVLDQFEQWLFARQSERGDRAGRRAAAVRRRARPGRSAWCGTTSGWRRPGS